MIFKLKIIVFFSVLVSLSPIRAHETHKCSRSCGSGDAAKHVPYPFGFSPRCQIRLNCSANGQILIGDFVVQSFNPDNILVNIKAKCNRPIQAIQQLFGRNYAPTSQNAILLHNCSSPMSPCIIPSTMVQTHFETMNCGSNSSNVTCYSGVAEDFIRYETVTRKGCKHLLSSISAEWFNGSAVSLEVQVVRLGWWLEGACRCSGNAFCSKLLSPVTGRRGYRCRCGEGYFGDGFRDGMGCRKVSSSCNPAKYMSGQCGGTTRLGVLIGGIAAGAALMTSLGLICCFIKRRSKSRTKYSTKRLLSLAASKCSIHVYLYKEIEKATDSFSEKNRLGTGAYGTVYAGKLHNNELVAIKRIRHRDSESIDQVMNEIKLLSSVSHPNLVRLIGCSIENGEEILVYEFMPNGTLCQHLQRERGEGLSWPVRVNIAAETAQAIAHLHSAIDPPIYHRDIKSSNILLDYNFRSKVADFGLSRLGRTEISHISTAPQGTPGYLDPQYHQNFHLSDRSDVYSFGVVLVEILTAMKVVDFSRPQNEVNLAALAIDRIGKGRLTEIIDPFLDHLGDEGTLSSIRKVAELAFRCLAFERDMRPSMMEVAAELEQIRLGRWLPLEETTNCTVSVQDFSELASFYSSSSSSLSNASEKPLGMKLKEADLESRGLLALQTGAKRMDSIEKTKDNSPVSVQDPWLSEQSSPSSSSLLNSVIR